MKKKMALFIPFNEKEERRKAREIQKRARWSIKNAFEELQDELESDYLEDPCADNEEILYDVTEFLKEFDDLDNKTISWFVNDYRLYFKKYQIRFY